MYICPNQHTDFFRSRFTEDSLKIKKGLELDSGPHFHGIFSLKKCSLVMLHKLAKFDHHTVFTFKLFTRMCFTFHA